MRMRALALLTAFGLAVPASAVAQPPAAPGDIVIRERPATPPPAMQWLYGSGEAGATGIQAYRALRDYVAAAARRRQQDSVVLAPGSTLVAPRFVPCGRRPLAIVLDIDETVIQNLGYEYDEAIARPAYDQARWNRWELTGGNAVLPIPGAVTALRAIRRAGVTVIFNSNRQTATGAATAAMLDAAGLGPARPGATLWLQGDVAPGSAKDPRRAAIVRRYCVIALVGDQLGDFSDLFNARDVSVPDRRRAAITAPFARLWGEGWFMLPNPVYGPGLRGSYDDVFPRDRRWTDPNPNEPRPNESRGGN